MRDVGLYTALAVAAALGIYLLYTAGMTLHRINVGKELAAGAEPFQKNGTTPRILVVGDSTAVGVGANTSIPAFFAEEFPDAKIVTRADSGNRLADVEDELEAIPDDARFDLVLIQAGANDIFWFTPLDSVRERLEAVLREANGIGDSVVVLHSGNIGLAPFFPVWLGWAVTERTKEVRRIYLEEADVFNATYVDLFTTRENDPFLENASRYYAADGLHLSADGYRFWYEKIRGAMRRDGISLRE